MNQKLYHFTSINNAINILNSNILRIGKNKTISFTEKSDSELPGISNTIMFIVDKSLLEKDFIIKDYKDDLSYGDTFNNEENEKIVETDIQNFSKYILNIILNINIMNQMNLENFIKDNIKNMKFGIMGDNITLDNNTKYINRYIFNCNTINIKNISIDGNISNLGKIKKIKGNLYLNCEVVSIPDNFIVENTLKSNKKISILNNCYIGYLDLKRNFIQSIGDNFKCDFLEVDLGRLSPLYIGENSYIKKLNIIISSLSDLNYIRKDLIIDDLTILSRTILDNVELKQTFFNSKKVNTIISKFNY